ncbi:MAG: ABC transporter ATP-binding protein [Thermodesulfobacteriota bacterium]
MPRNTPLEHRLPILTIQNLKTYFFTDAGVAKAVDGLNLTLLQGESLGIVGESGCGKSMTGLSILRLVPKPFGRIVSGRILFNGSDILSISEQEMIKVRGNKISMIFQEPMTSLNPVFTIGEQISETLRFHRKLSRKEGFDRSIELLTQVGIPSPELRIKDYPSQLSGGMRQRVMIAMALACRPKIIIADEPTTALDVTIQAQILDLMQKLREETDSAIILITHDLGVIAENAQHVAVMYTGRVFEFAEVEELFNHPLHPYTLGLMESIPRVGSRKDRLNTIPGLVPSVLELPLGCKFSDRCSYSRPKCEEEEPDLLEYKPGHLVRCWKYV